MKMPLRIGVPTGIGDVIWALTKVPSILCKENREKTDILVCTPANTNQAVAVRSHELLRSFDFVNSVTAVDYPIHPPGRHWETNGFIYLNSGPLEKPNSANLDYLLIPNYSLERGVRIEEFLPDFGTDFDVVDRVVEREKIGPFGSFDPTLQRYFILYLSAAQYYDSDCGFNVAFRDDGVRWTEENWMDLMCRLYDFFGGRVRPVIVGADFDRQLSNRFCEKSRQFRADVTPVNLCGKTPGPDLVSILRRSVVTIGYPSGVPILSTYLGVPTIMFWNGTPVYKQKRADGVLDFLMFTPGFATSWVPPGYSGWSYDYLRFGMATVDDVMQSVGHFQNRGLLEVCYE